MSEPSVNKTLPIKIYEWERYGINLNTNEIVDAVTKEVLTIDEVYDLLNQQDATIKNLKRKLARHHE